MWDSPHASTLAHPRLFYWKPSSRALCPQQSLHFFSKKESYILLMHDRTFKATMSRFWTFVFSCHG